MNYKRQGLRALGLSILAALGLMAFMAPGAQAGAGEWLILTTAGPTTVKDLSALEKITGKQEGLKLENLFQILGLNIRLTCEKVHVSSAHIVPLGHAKATLEFLECKLTDAAGNTNTTCLVADIKTDVLGLLIKHPTVVSTQRWILFSPLTGLTFVTPLFHDLAPEECSVTAAEIKGHVVASISTVSGAHALEPLISTKGLLTLFPNDKLFFGTQEGHLKVDALVSLNGTHAGRAWGYDAHV